MHVHHIDTITYIAIDCIGNNLAKKKYEFFKNLIETERTFDTVSKGEIRRFFRFSRNVESSASLLRRAEAILHDMERHNISLTPITSSAYPPRLKEIYDPPFVLYHQGEIPQGITCSVVGSRNIPTEVSTAAFAFGLELALSQVPLVSGFAYGVDISAHRGTLAGGGQGVVVLGSGHKHLTPRAHYTYVKKTLSLGGAIISEYPPDTEARRYSFPQRNRIISGLSPWTLLVGAPKKSGALITADFALEQGRDVFVHPVGITKSWGAGGALLVETGAELIEHLDELASVVDNLPFSPARVAEVRESDYTIERMVALELSGIIYRYKTKRFQRIL